jgi:hypothetical protein
MPDPIIVSFPTAGTMTVRANEAGAVVDASVAREQVICTLIIAGGRPAFTFQRLKKGGAVADVLQDSATQPVAQRYQWVLSAADGTLANGEATYTLSLSFLGASRYTYTMEHCDEFGARITMLKDIDYESANGNDRRHEPIGLEAQ